MINPRRACAARVTVCLSVCVRLIVNISRLERLFVLKTLSHTQRAAKVKMIGGISLKQLGCTCGAAIFSPLQKDGCTVMPPSKHNVMLLYHASILRYTYEHAHTSSYAHAPRVCTLVIM